MVKLLLILITFHWLLNQSNIFVRTIVCMVKLGITPTCRFGFITIVVLLYALLVFYFMLISELFYIADIDCLLVIRSW
jgi:hypothetical protein